MIAIYNGEDTAADWTPEGGEAPRRKTPRLDLDACAVWEAAWKRGLVSDVDMAWYLAMVHAAPRSFLNWFMAF